MILGSMAALTNGASVQIWSQKATPLVAQVYHIGDPQAGKSRLFGVVDEFFDACDGVVAEHVRELIEEACKHGRGIALTDSELPVTVKSINLQSFTMPEFFARCSSTYAQVSFDEGDARSQIGVNISPWKGRAFNLDEARDNVGR